MDYSGNKPRSTSDRAGSGLKLNLVKESERNSNVDLGLFLKNMGGLTLGAYFGIFHT
jgi:hypothetical protein